MADTSVFDGPADRAASGPNDEPPHTQTDFSQGLTHTDRDKLEPGLATPTTDSTTVATTVPPPPPSSSSSLSSSSTTTTVTPSKRVTMDGDVDGAPTTIAAITTPHSTTTEMDDDGSNTSTPRGRPKENGSADSGSKGSSAESTPRRSGRAKSANPPSTHGRDRATADLSGLDMKTSWDGSATSSVIAAVKAGMLADPTKIAKEREKEERVRQARERLEEERRKKLEELKEQQRLAQENRDKQLEMRRKKIEDLRQRDFERRAAVEERRKMKEEIERIRRESILQKAEERVARYEAWKAGGRKGGRGHVLGFGSGTPRDICQPSERPRRSSSHSALQRRSPNGSDIDSMRPQRRALSACSAVRRHCCVDINRMGMFGMDGSTPKHLSMSTSVLYHKRNPDFSSATALSPVHRPESSLGLNTIREGRRSFVGRTSGGGVTSSSPANTSLSSSHHLQPGGTWSPVRMRERNSPRKQRPSSVATSMPSFVGGEPAKFSPRSKSSDRTSRDRSKHKAGLKDDKASKDRAKGKDKDDNKDDNDSTTKKGRVSLSFFDRLATPKFNRGQRDQSKEPPPKKDAPIIRIISVDAGEEDDNGVEEADDNDRDGSAVNVKLFPRKAYSTTNLATMRKRSSLKERPTKDTPSSKQTPTVNVREPRGPSPKVTAGGMSSSMTKSMSSPRRTPPPPSSTVSPQHTASTTPSSGPATQGGASEDGTTGPRGINVDITEEAYKAKLAEKRRQAREKAEREAEEERKRQEEARIAEEERLRQEEEEQRRMEEEANRLAEEARKAEEVRLQKAIEAEEKRKKEEAERLEQERKAKEEAERKAKEEAERLEKEKQERIRKEDEERQQRKKKLEMIMKRVKTDPAQDSTSQKSESPTKSVGNSPNRSMVSSPDVQERPSFPQSTEAPVAGVDAQPKEPESSSTEAEEGGNTDVPTATSVPRSASSGDILDGASAHEEAKEREKEALSMTTSTSDVTPSPASKTETDGTPQAASESSTAESKSRFKSPLLQQLVENKGGDSSSQGTPKFKSPLLQNLLGKTKVGARMGLSSSMSDLSSNKGDNSPKSDSASTSPYGSSKEISKQGKDDEDKDQDESVSHGTGDRSMSTSESDAGHMTNGVEKDLVGGDAVDIKSSSVESSSPQETTKISPSGMSDSALGASIGPGMMSQSLHLANGHSKDIMQDSSISLHSVDGGIPSSTSTQAFDQVPASTADDSSNTVSVSGSQSGAGDGGQFEELIDLLDSTTGSGGKANAVLATGTPIIAFEENNRMTDVSESLS